jgi:HTH-type transcriptional regulator, transcriptional repressor of NAD biosynthesis genes
MSKRILFIGGESSGKTTICQVLSRLFNLPWVPEYGRELFDKKNGKLDYEDMLEIGRVQVQREKIVQVCTREQWVLCDTSPLVTKFYSQDWFGKVDPNLETLSRRQYDKVFLCVRDFPYVNDGTRSGDEFSYRQQDFYMKNLLQSFFFLTGSIESRVVQVQKAMQQYV